MRKLTAFPFQNVLVLGLAKSGTAVAKLFSRNDVQVTVNDLRAKKNDKNVLELKNQGVEVVLGDHPLSLLDQTDLIVKNPGIPYENPLINEAVHKGIPVVTEIELLYYLGIEKLIGITGSNGKTTTTTLIYEMLKYGEVSVEIAGNIGHVASEVAEQVEEDQAMVVELSSFQLLGTQKFVPQVAVVLNMFEAHLDYHQTMENYMQAKANIFKNQTSDDFLVYNADDEKVQSMVQSAKSTLVPFSCQKFQNEGAYSDGTSIFFNGNKIISLDEIVLVGEHNIENILAAVAVAKTYQISNDTIRKVLSTFTGVKHRLQFVDKVNGRLFYNDSKATNILATSKALSAFSQPTILLAGGLDRGNGFEALSPYLQNVKAFILFGETADKFKEVGEQYGIPFIKHVHNMEEAVQTAYALSEKGDVILLSPACASWDQYKTFEQRGNMFIDSVHRL
ncbi:UDP-N-acetylmuramoyl-L-alanine--D-glutamate ligase [Gracilibacillus sp. YIM 98692]|uniref:UDP-N-acetylmuramoyl-L-alanine--D-glutamate ligase n=1 Tax=Gracilibacillus sp. YIM 98692 TaxID=2663532 RepID=UPI0013D3C839|nr:UDP-N-acetylmuramoyl-L-alanine--D-glutamate ligase [Gracilibacillus sp. YIM 98692]